jgi:hypothetical protein
VQGLAFIEIGKSLLQRFNGRAPCGCPWFANRILIAEHSDLLDRPFQRYSLEPLDGHEELVVATLGYI